MSLVISTSFSSKKSVKSISNKNDDEKDEKKFPKMDYSKLQAKEYGFESTVKPDLIVQKQSWMDLYTKSIEAQIELWKKSGIDKSKRKSLCRSGIPTIHRFKIWYEESGAVELQKKLTKSNKDFYARLLSNEVENSQSQSKSRKDIDRDFDRTFTSHPYFRQNDGRQALRRCLLAYATYCPEIGYCQSMNFICGLLLLFYTEEQAFYMLAAIIENFLSREYYSNGMIMAQVDSLVCKKLIEKKFPKLHQHLFNMKVDISIVVVPWLICMFARSLPIETAFRVWDCLFVEGDKIFFRVTLAIFKLNYQNLMKQNDADSVIKYITEMSNAMFDCDLLLNTCFNNIGSLSRSSIEKLRKSCRKEIEKEMNVLNELRRIKTT